MQEVYSYLAVWIEAGAGLSAHGHAVYRAGNDEIEVYLNANGLR